MKVCPISADVGQDKLNLECGITGSHIYSESVCSDNPYRQSSPCGIERYTHGQNFFRMLNDSRRSYWTLENILMEDVVVFYQA